MFQVLSVMQCVNNWYLNFNCCSSEQHPLKTVGKTQTFWNWKNLEILRGEFTFDFTKLHSFTYPCVKLNLDWPLNFIVKIQFWKFAKIYILCDIELSLVCTLTAVYQTHAGLGSAYCNMDWCWNILWTWAKCSPTKGFYFPLYVFLTFAWKITW